MIQFLKLFLEIFFMKKLVLLFIFFFSLFSPFIIFANNAERDKECDKNGDCFDKPSFKLDVNDFTPWGKEILQKVWSSSVEEKANFFLWTAIQKMMIALWVLALLIMTAWGGFMILYSGKEEMLSKWKSLFMAGIIALFVALMSYVFISVIVFILYNN